DETAFTIAEQNENQQIMNLLIKNLPHSEREVKYYFRANGGSVLFFDDGTAFRCARCELSNNLDSYEPNITYKEFPNYLLMEGGIKWELYDRYGDIAADWVIVNYQKYKNIDSFYENQTDNSAVKMLREFYTQYITQNAKVDGYDHNVIIAIQNSYLSKDLLKKLKEAELDYLPFLNAQDCELDWLETLEIVPQNNDGNSYKVCFYYQDNLRKCITLFLVENNGKYLIDDLEKL
ncbi:MAG: YbjP/YqhG family protein, partial [Campylobacteraceae bacterium]|nr:YbjP/YqhG family protein [Campylobacteraceae bacterium]